MKNTRCLCIFTIQRNIFHAISSLIWIITCGFGRSTNVGSISKLEWFLWITSTELLHSLAHKSLYCKNSFKRHRMKSVTIVKRTIWTMPINSFRIKKSREKKWNFWSLFGEDFSWKYNDSGRTQSFFFFFLQKCKSEGKAYCMVHTTSTIKPLGSNIREKEHRKQRKCEEHDFSLHSAIVVPAGILVQF